MVNENKEISNGESETSLEQVKDPNIENKLDVPEKELQALSSMKPEEIVLDGFDESASKFDANRGSFMAEIKMECEENVKEDNKPACNGAVVVENNNDTPLEKNSKIITNACNNKNSMNKESARFDTSNEGTDNLKRNMREHFKKYPMDQKLSKEYIEGIYTGFLKNNPTLRVSKAYFFKFYRLMNLKRKENRGFLLNDNFEDFAKR